MHQFSSRHFGFGIKANGIFLLNELEAYLCALFGRKLA
tara:strand:- start:448 stop:561 length:114 start_codon:yes stop_codon:yes gene_type:complete